MHFNDIKKVIATAVLFCMAVPVFAEDAPVYDVDSYPPQFDGQPFANMPAADIEPRPPGPGYAREESSPQPQLSLGQRIQRAEQQINNMQHATASTKIDSLQSEIQSLRSQVEELTHQVQQLQTQQRAMYTDIDSRVSQLSTTKSPAPTKSVKSAPVETEIASSAKSKSAIKKSQPSAAAMSDATSSLAGQPNVAEEQQIYQTAYDLIKAKKYNEAILTLKKMLQKYPSGQFAANAHYWLGELYGLLNKNAESAAEFSIIVNDYPKSPKVADAQLKLGLIYLADSKWPDAKSTFKKVINRYPGSASAHLASEQLKQLKVMGH